MKELDYTEHDRLTREWFDADREFRKLQLLNTPPTLEEELALTVETARAYTAAKLAQARVEGERERLIAAALLRDRQPPQPPAHTCTPSIAMGDRLSRRPVVITLPPRARGMGATNQTIAQAADHMKVLRLRIDALEERIERLRVRRNG